MQLFSHNERAYKNALNIFKGKNVACIIHPTGTGKAVIIAKCIRDHPDARHLILASGAHIFAEIKKHCFPQNATFLTYHGLDSLRTKSIDAKFDFIYLDEFHRIGAETWEPAVKTILSLNSNAKILGTTATHIRYLDNQRDMAAELFAGSIASHISLFRAFLEGILWPPKYVNALYSIDEEYAALAARIHSSDAQNKKILASDLRIKCLNWSETLGIDAILKKHLPGSRRRIVVFCSSYDEMSSAEAVILPPLKDIFQDIEPLHIHSRLKESHNKAALNNFRKRDKTAKVLFTVDMMNEGLHGKDISVAILMRPTTSPIIFYQQIGRCFSIGQTEQPIVFDFVNNFKNIQVHTFKKEYEAEALTYGQEAIGSANSIRGLNTDESANSAIEFVDETQDVRKVFEEVECQLESFEIYFQKALLFFTEHGHLYIPKSQRRLYGWVYRQREAYKEGTLDPDRRKRLEQIGIDWNSSIEEAWIQKYERLKHFTMASGLEPSAINDKELAEWIKWQRRLYADGKLSDNRKLLLSSLVSLEMPRTQVWNEKLKILMEYKQKNGEFRFSQKDPIYQTIKQIRAAIRNNSLPPSFLKSLDEVGLTLRKYAPWEENFASLKCFYGERGRLPTTVDNKALARWIADQRHLATKGKLDGKRRVLLQEIGVLIN
jgi:superfamily II DNA or RNA helicase